MRKSRLAFVVGVCGVALGAGVAYAAIPDESGVFHACYKTNGGQVRLVNSANDCNGSETATQWSQTGPQGPSGSRGPSGPQGDPGVFSGVFESPNHQFKLEVTDTGISLTGPTAKILLRSGGIEVNSQGPDGVVLKTSAAKVEVQNGTVSVDAPGLVQVTGGQVQLGHGCRPVARIGDFVDIAGAIGVVLTGSPTVCAG
jgi:hypothetical protein